MANSRFPVIAAAKSGISTLVKAAFAGRIPFLPGMTWVYRAKFQVVVAGGVAYLRNGSHSPYTDTALPAALTTTIDLHTAAPRLLFPANVTLLRGSSVRVRANTTGLTTCSIIVGDANDDNGLVTVSNLHTGTVGRRIITPAAQEYEEHFESAFIPQIVLVSTVDNLSAATAGSFDVRIPFRVEDA